MKLSEYIKHLEKIKEKHGDNEVAFSVKDYYSRYGEAATTILNTDAGIWDGVFSSNGLTTLTVNLKSKEGKNPKIMFRN